jgi:hypothetical protein
MWRSTSRVTVSHPANGCVCSHGKKGKSKEIGKKQINQPIKRPAVAAFIANNGRDRVRTSRACSWSHDIKTAARGGVEVEKNTLIHSSTHSQDAWVIPKS